MYLNVIWTIIDLRTNMFSIGSSRMNTLNLDGSGVFGDLPLQESLFNK